MEFNSVAITAAGSRVDAADTIRTEVSSILVEQGRARFSGIASVTRVGFFSPSPLMRFIAILGGLLRIRIHAMHLNSFLQAFNKLGLTQCLAQWRPLGFGFGRITGFFLQVQVWCGPTLMQNMMVAAPLI